MASNIVVDEMFPEGSGSFMDVDEGHIGTAGGKEAFGGSIKDVIGKGANIIHSDFDNNFGDLFDDDDDTT